MGIGMKKYIRTIFITAIMAMLCIGFFMYLSNREPSQTATEKDLAKQEVDNLTTIDIEKNYPESPKEVIKLYARITKAYYKGNLTDAQIEALGNLSESASSSLDFPISGLSYSITGSPYSFPSLLTPITGQSLSQCIG